MIPSFSPRSAPLELSGASRIQIIVRSPYSRTTKLTFPCSRDKLPGHANSNISEALEAVFRLAISFRRWVLLHARKPSDGELKCPTSVMTGRTR